MTDIIENNIEITVNAQVHIANVLKTDKSCKNGDIPAEAFKAIAADKGAAFAWVLEFLICKKGDPGFCANYRPICLLSIAHKIFAAVLKQRLLTAGIDETIWASQFGFRSACSTDDAIVIARRRIEITEPSATDLYPFLRWTGKLHLTA